MSHFLWVEDFENKPSVTASYVFSGVIDENNFSDNRNQLKDVFEGYGIYIELSLQNGLHFIENDLHKVDYIILDIDLPVSSRDDEPTETINELLGEFYSAGELDDESELSYKRAELKKVAGYHIYIKLIMDFGFPKENILFCSDHGDQMKTIHKAFVEAKISCPEIYKKSDDFVKDWVKERYENPYSRLRRGIIEGCKYLKDLPDNKFQFTKFVSEISSPVYLADIHNYLDVLERFLPLCKPDDATVTYKLFIRTLAHEWEAADPKSFNERNKHKELFAFSSIMKMSRNWLAHGKVFENLNEQDLAYIFIVNMRAMFDLGDKTLAYEKQLLDLFKPLSEQEMKTKIGHPAWKYNESDYLERKIPLAENYAAVLTKTKNTRQAINFHDALNNLQKYKSDITENDFFITGLYQTFWFLTSNGNIHIPHIPDEDKIKHLSDLRYKFKYFDYQPNYLFELARHIYNRSFPNKY